MNLKPLLFVPFLAAMGNSLPPESSGPPVVESAPSQPITDAPTPQAELRVFVADQITPQDLMWHARPVVVFADTPENPSFVQQMQALTRDPAPLTARDVVVVTDSDPAANGPWRRALNPARGFSLVVVDKDGTIEARKPLPWDVREISRTIDKLPSRRQEIGRAGLTP